MLQVIEKGYVIPLTGNVETVFLRNNRSSRMEPNFVQESIDELFASKAIVELSEPAFLTNPLTVGIKNGNKRLVIDRRHLNSHLVRTHCKYEGHETIKQYLDREGFMTAFDL